MGDDILQRGGGVFVFGLERTSGGEEKIKSLALRMEFCCGVR